MSASTLGLTPDEKRLYSQLFKSLDPEASGIITGEKARATFEKSGLPPAILGEIWQLSDTNNLGFLTQFGFCYAMRLIGYAQAGHAPSSTIADSPGPLPNFAGLGPLQPQLTNSSLLQSQPSSHGASGSQPQDPIPPVSPADYQKFSELFVRTTGLPLNPLGGALARDIFLKAKLPTEVLGQIWNLVDTENLGKLSMASFVVAMHLIQGLLGGSIKQLPPFLPESIWASVQPKSSRQASYASVSSQQTVRHTPQSTGVAPATSAYASNEWTVPAATKQQYEAIFANLDKAKTGQLNPDQVASFLTTSKLGQQDLATVWDLADIQNTGVFSKLEFSIALFMVNRKLAGGALPNVVPESLIKSLSDSNSSAPVETLAPAPAPVPAPVSPPKPLTTQKTSMDELADVFGSPAPTPVPEKPVQQVREVSSLSDLPKVRKNLTGFRPTSSFGQSLMKELLLLGDDVQGEPAASPASPVPAASVPSAAAIPTATGASTSTNSSASGTVPATKSINYDALRSVPPPPKKSSAGHTPIHSPPVQSPQELERNLSTSFQAPANNDLLADPTSGQLSQATSDIANISNQVKSLSSQTSELHDKKSRAEQELSKILSVKKEIEAKLRLLRSSYDNEVKQHQEVETSLAKAKEESEALRSESSISEAKFNHLSSQLNEKQVAMENLQKENGAVREKLGTINAEISELESLLANVAAENHSLTNQLSVKKSQVQVVLVKKQELQAQIAEQVAANKKLQEEINLQAQQEAQAHAEHQSLQQQLQQAKLFTPTQPEKQASAPSHSLGKVAAGVAGVAGAVGVGLGAAVASKSDSDSNTKGEVESQEVQSKEVEPKEIEAQGTESKEVESKEVEPEQTLPETPSKSVASEANKEYSVEGLVDEVKDKPEADLTGIDDIHEIATPKFDERTTTTDSNASTADGETPITSPSNSEYQFPQGSMLGMPGVLVGVQRTDSLTSSVQNNAAMSVRDDNIEVSDRDTIGMEDVSHEEEPAKEVREGHQESDGDKLSSGVESFELVNAEDAKSEEDKKESQTFVIKNPISPDAEEEFPPIKELDYDESDSSDEDFHEAKDLTRNADEKKNAFDSAFDDLEPAVEDTPSIPGGFQQSSPEGFGGVSDQNVPGAFPQETAAKGEFVDDFDNLEIAKDEAGDDDFANNTDDFFNNDFTNSNMPDFGEPQPLTEAKTGNDEWEQLFAGFSNSTQTTPAQATQAVFPDQASGPHNELVQELVGMGFDESTATKALESQGWDLEAATNYLLDNA